MSAHAFLWKGSGMLSRQWYCSAGNDECSLTIYSSGSHSAVLSICLDRVLPFTEGCAFWRRLCMQRKQQAWSGSVVSLHRLLPSFSASTIRAKSRNKALALKTFLHIHKITEECNILVEKKPSPSRVGLENHKRKWKRQRALQWIGCAVTLGGGSEDLAGSQPGVQRISFDLRRKCESLFFSKCS